MAIMLEAKLLGVSVAERTAFYIADNGYDPRSIELCWVSVVIAVTFALFTGTLFFDVDT